MSTEDIRKQIRYDEDKEKKKNRAVYLPADFTLSIPEAPLAWLRKYGVTDDERNYYRIGWSDENRALVFSAYDKFNNLLLLQYRTHPEKSFYTRGFPESSFWFALPAGCGDVGDGGSVCVVEDYISAIRVGRIMPAMPLWGSNLSLGQVRRLSDYYENLFLWLDMDKASHAAKLAIKARPYFKTVTQIVSEHDPKDYSDSDIATRLGVVQ